MKKAIGSSCSLRAVTQRCSLGPPRFVRDFHNTLSEQAASNFAMPALSPTMSEGNIAVWKIKPGDSFSAGDVLLEVETDKAQMEVEAPDDGVLAKILLNDGEKGVKVGSPIAVLAEEGDDLQILEMPEEQEKAENDASKPSEKQKQPSGDSNQLSQKVVHEVKSPKGQPLSPAVLSLLQKNGINDANVIKGSGPKGRILKGDVLAHLGKISKNAPLELKKKLRPLEHLDLSNIKIRKPSKEGTPSAKPDKPAKPQPIQKELLSVKQVISLEPLSAFQRASTRSGAPITLHRFLESAAAKAFQDIPEFSSRRKERADEIFDELVGAEYTRPQSHFKPKAAPVPGPIQAATTISLPDTLPKDTSFTFEPVQPPAPMAHTVSPTDEIYDILCGGAPVHATVEPVSVPVESKLYRAQIALDKEKVKLDAAKRYLDSLKSYMEQPQELFL